MNEEYLWIIAFSMSDKQFVPHLHYRDNCPDSPPGQPDGINIGDEI
jgi:hypothetical protein